MNLSVRMPVRIAFGNDTKPQETKPAENQPEAKPAAKKETAQEMAARHAKEAMDARVRAGGGDPRHAQVPEDVQRRHRYERDTLAGRDTRYGY